MDELRPHREADEVRPVQPRPVVRRKSVFWRIFWIVVILGVLGGLGWWIIHRPAQQARPAGRFSTTGPMPVVPATVQKGDVNIILNALGTVTPLATVTVRTQINGQLLHIDFQEGQLVKKGDPLAEIDSRPYEFALEQAEGTLLRDQALLDGARVDLARYRKLATQDSIARQQVDTQAHLVDQYVGTVKTDQGVVDNAKLNIAYCHIVAPATGRVGLRQVDPGNYVQVSDANGIVVITQLQPITTLFSLPEDNLGAVMARLKTGATLPVTAFDRSQLTKLATGKLSTVDNQIDTTTGTVKLRAVFDNTDERLFPNQFVNVQLLVDVVKDAAVIPAAAVQRGAPGTFVYLIKPDDTVTVQVVKLGQSQGDRTVVLSGLSLGDKVVVDGADKLRDGAKISLREPNNTPTAVPGGPITNGASSGNAAAPAAPNAPADSNTPANPKAPANANASQGTPAPGDATPANNGNQRRRRNSNP